jgi:hypothetical protein
MTAISTLSQGAIWAGYKMVGFSVWTAVVYFSRRRPPAAPFDPCVKSVRFEAYAKFDPFAAFVKSGQ